LLVGFHLEKQFLELSHFLVDEGFEFLHLFLKFALFLGLSHLFLPKHDLDLSDEVIRARFDLLLDGVDCALPNVDFFLL